VADVTCLHGIVQGPLDELVSADTSYSAYCTQCNPDGDWAGAFTRALRLWLELDALHLDRVALVSSPAGYTLEVGGGLRGDDLAAVVRLAREHGASITLDLDEPLFELHFPEDE
jgi:hypothetical protein